MDKLEYYYSQIDQIMEIFPEYFIDKNTSEAKRQLINNATERLKLLAKIIYNDGIYDGKSGNSK